LYENRKVFGYGNVEDNGVELKVYEAGDYWAEPYSVMEWLDEQVHFGDL